VMTNWTSNTATSNTATSNTDSTLTLTWKNVATSSATCCDWDTNSGWVSMVPTIPAKLPAEARELELPDGAKLIIDGAGNYRVDDQDAQVVYQANRIREFSPHLNASDMVARFVEYVGSLGVRKADVLGLPLHLFIAWLVIEAADRDGDDVPEGIVAVDKDPYVIGSVRPRCLGCGRFIKKLHQRNRFPFCSPEHGARYMRQKPNGLITVA